MTDGPSAPSTTVSPDPAGVASRPPSSGAQPILPLALTALAVSLLAGATATAALLALHDLIGPDASTLALLIMGALALAAWAPAWPAVSALLAGRRRAALVLEHDVVRARHTAATGRESARTSMGYALAVLVGRGAHLLRHRQRRGPWPTRSCAGSSSPLPGPMWRRRSGST